MKLGVLFSGGKDSTYAAYKAKQKGNKLICLISIFSQNPDSYMFHTPNINLVKDQATVMGLPLLTQKTKGEKEEELKDLEKAIKSAKTKYKIQGIVTGALKSEYQVSRIQKICDKLDLKCINPLWHKDELEYLHELIENRFKIIITSVAAYPLDETWLGREINQKFISDAVDLNNRYKIHMSGEGGETESFIIDCPLFSKKINILEGRKTWDGSSGRYDIKEVELIDK